VRYALNKSRMLRLADYSRVALAELRAETGIEYDQRMKGTLQLFRTQSQVDASGKDIKALAADDIPFQVLDRRQCIAVEPALGAVSDRFVGGLLTPQDETGDCFKFTTALAEKAAALGVSFRYGVEVRALDVDQGRVRGVTASQGSTAADSVVVALGSHSPGILRRAGIRIPVYPVKGYSLTVPIIDARRAPESTVMDETYKIAITRLGDRIRVGGMAEISGYNDSLPPSRRCTLEHSVRDLFPGGDLSQAQFWSGLRPMTPDGTPIIGPTDIAGLYTNTGHGTLGWTMSCGSARLIADFVAGRSPQIDPAGLSVSRYH
jgi:D-amino-acid dehydrogenase